MLRFPIIILFGFLILSFLISNNRFGEVLLIDLLLALCTKFITLFSLEISQEDMLKFIVEESVSVKLWLEVRYLSSTMLLFMSTFLKDVDALKNYYLNMKQNYCIKPFYLIVVNGDCVDKDVPL